MTKEKNQRTLHLVLIRKWWDGIESLVKPEEYRDILFWCVRLLNVDREGYGHFQKACKGDFEDLKRQSGDSIKEFIRLLKQAIADGIFEFRDYDAVCFHRGYTNVTMLYEFKGTSIGYGNPAWGAPKEKEVFIIKLGKRI
ncbi:MAG: hypothetical protein HDS59_05155 [Barnesiella sp.]|nr:hypothetical protein [Barnesiella sp.]